jgi:signal transduction histidine kinase
MYAAMKNEFKLLADVFSQYLPPEYPYDVVGAQRMVKQTDFDDNVDIIPVADPNIFSQSQRISLAQTELQLAMSNPQIHNMYEAYRDMYEAIGVKNIDQILPPPQQPMPMDPASENILAMSGKPFQAFKGQDHRSHIAFMAQEQIEIEFMQELQQLQQLQMAVQQNPMLQQDPNTQQQILTLTLSLEARKAKLIADMTQEFKEEENQIMGQLGNDPIAKLKARELDLRAMNDDRKAQDAEARLSLDKMKAMMAQENNEDKLDQNEELAKLRANTSIEKTILSKTIPSAPKMDQPVGNVAIIRGKR